MKPAVLLLPALLCASSASAGDLDRIERVIGREPPYRSGAPQYCLAVFGPEAAERVWFVFDGDRLYVDRNANGDLTEEGECLERPDEVAAIKVAGTPYREFRYYRLNSLSSTHDRYTSLRVLRAVPKVDLSEEHSELRELLRRNPHYTETNIDVTIDRQRRQDAGPAFAPEARAAPIIHFDGPQTLTFWQQPMLRIGAETAELQVTLGTPGLGAHTFVETDYAGVSDEVHPGADLEFRSQAGEPIRIRVELQDRC